MRYVKNININLKSAKLQTYIMYRYHFKITVGIKHLIRENMKVSLDKFSANYFFGKISFR